MNILQKSLSTVVLSLLISQIYAANERGFAALAGCIPDEIQELVSYSKISTANNSQYMAKLPKGILLAGPTGSGKTSMAKALSEDLGCPFIYRSACNLDSNAILDLFNEARNKAKSSSCGKTIIFIDDFDICAGTKLTADMITLLNEMDGFKPDESVTVIAACNHPENFDKSLLRSGRFDKVIEIALPDPAQREVMLKRFNDKIPFAPELSLTKIAALTYNFTPADLKQLINYAHLFAKKENARNLTERHFLQAIIKVLQARYRTDKDLAVRLKVVSALLNMKKDEKKGFARLVGAVPSEIIELVNQIKNDSLYKAFKLDLPKGILLTGPPGTGKTSLVRALSEEAGCEFMAVSGAEFIDPYVGAGAQKIRALFKEARQKAINSEAKRTIIFVDELDSIGKRQGNTLDATVTELLTQMDGFEEDDSIIVIAASNHPSNIDQALLRPGRFNKIIKIGLPDLDKRELILKHYTQGITLAPDVDIKKIAQATNNSSPADLRELIQKASSLALQEGLKELKEKHFVEALRKLLTERMLKGEKDIQQQLDALDVMFGGKTVEKGFKRLVGGVEPAIEDLLKMMKGELDYKRFGVPFPKGILLAGPPGTGKTALVRALAEEAGCEFIQAKGSEFIEKYVGVGAQRIRDLFTQARAKSEGNRFGKTIVFIDEIDAIGSRATSDNSETRQTVTELLTQMDGFYKDESVIVIGATNAPTLLDPALLRAGRFDTLIEVPLPNLQKRIALLQYYGKNRPLDPAISFDKIATSIEGCNAADVKNLVDKAAQIAMRSQSAAITQAHFDQALAAIKASEDNKKNIYV